MNHNSALIALEYKKRRMVSPSSIVDQSSTMIETIAMFLLSAASIFQLHVSCAKLPKQEGEMTSMTIVDGYGPPGPSPDEDYINNSNNEQDTSRPLNILFWYHRLVGGQIIYPDFASDDQTYLNHESLGNNLLRKACGKTNQTLVDRDKPRKLKFGLWTSSMD